MKRERLSKKALIKKQIEIRNAKSVFIKKKDGNRFNMNERDNLRIYGNIYGNRPIDNSLVSNSDKRNYFPLRGTYQKKTWVDFDIVVCIPSYNRYEKVMRLIHQFVDQPTQYTLKIILLNDGSNDSRYDDIQNEYPEIIYVKNDVPNGKVKHWCCYGQMWKYLKDIQSHVVLQMDDDFILCDNFLNTIIDLYFRLKEDDNNVMGIAPHLWSFKPYTENESWWKRRDFVDGIALLDDNVIKSIGYSLNPVDEKAISKPGATVRVWSQISQAIVNMNGIIYRTPISYVYHDGNDDSKLHGDVRLEGKGGVYTQKYIGKL